METKEVTQPIQTFLQFHKAVREKALPETYSTIEIKGDGYGRTTYRAYIHNLGWFEGATPESCIEQINAPLSDITIVDNSPQADRVTLETGDVT